MPFMGWTKEDMKTYWFKIPSKAEGIFVSLARDMGTTPDECIAFAPGWLYEKGNTKYMIPCRGVDSSTEYWLAIKKDNGDELVHCLNPQCKRHVIQDDENPFLADYYEKGQPAFYVFESARKDAPPRLMTCGEIIRYCEDWAEVLREFPKESESSAKVIINHLEEQADILEKYKSDTGCLT